MPFWCNQNDNLGSCRFDLSFSFSLGLSSFLSRCRLFTWMIQRNVLLVIITDGENTDSHGYQQPQVKSMITDLEKNHGWTVAYLGANQDAWSVGSSLGLSRGNTMNYTTSNMAGTMRAMGAVSSSYMAASSLSKSVDPHGIYFTHEAFADAGVKEDDLTK